MCFFQRQLKNQIFFLYYSTCIGAAWECRPATPEEIVAYPRAADIKDKCSAAKNEEFTTCEPAAPLTCKVYYFTLHMLNMIDVI